MGPTPRGLLTIEARSLAVLLANLAHQKRAEDVTVLHLKSDVRVADYFVLATGLNRNHVRALQNEMHLQTKGLGVRHQPVEGGTLHWWVVLDFGDVVVHLQQPEARAYYDMDRLYADCERVDWAAEKAADPDLSAAEA